MKYSNTALKELTARYKSILKKCAYLNAVILVGAMMTTPVMAGTGLDGIDTLEYSANSDLYTTTDDTTVGSFSGYDATANDGSSVLFATGKTLTVSDNAVVSDNKAQVGGAIAVSGANPAVLSIGSGVKFTNNSAIYDGGAIANFGSTIIAKNVEFTGNTAQSDILTDMTDDTQPPTGGGAISLGSTSDTTIENSTFNTNTSYYNGGAIATRHTVNTMKQNNSAGTYSVTGSTFKGNKALGTVTTVDEKPVLVGGNGGAIFNSFYNNIAVSDSTFDGNHAQNNGGAIYNYSEADNNGKAGDMVLTNNIFKNNTAGNWAGAVFNGAAMTITGGEFTNNSATFAGALSSGTASTRMNIENVTFTGNSADEIGAVGLFGSEGNLTNVTFTGNSATSTAANSDGAGALFLGAVSKTVLDTVVFDGNTSGTKGGAIATRTADMGNNTNARLDILNSIFKNNKATTNGGAFDNFLYSSKQDDTAVYVSGTTFEANSAANGGAIYNHGETDKGGNTASTIVADSTFTGNTATTAGGAIFNAGGLTLSGTNVFSANTAGGIANDIHNTGSLKISGNLTLDGGITGTGSVAFSETSLTAALKSSASINGDITGLDKVTIAGLVVETGLSDGSHKLTSTGDAEFADITAENALYTFEQGDNWGEIKITKKSSEAITETLTSAGASETAAQTAAAVTEAKPTTAAATAVADAITTAAQTGDTATLNALSEAINPADLAIVSQQSVNTATQIFNVAGTRMAANSMGRSGGSMADFAYGPWIQGLYNKTHNSQGNGYDGYSQGFALGVDVDVSKSVMLGAGYGYTATDIKMSGRKTQVYTDNVFLYGKYQPSKWYVSGVLNYGHSNYKETAALTSNYDVDTYAANAMVGYDTGIFDNYAGVRYTYVNPDSYSNGLTEVEGKNAQIGTAVIGTRISKEFKGDSVSWKPEFRLAATYDFKSDNSTSFVNMVGGSTSYIVEGKRLKRFGVETGVGMTATIAKNTDLTVSYDAGLRDEQVSQTGSAKLKFHF